MHITFKRAYHYLIVSIMLIIAGCDSLPTTPHHSHTIPVTTNQSPEEKLRQQINEAEQLRAPQRDIRLIQLAQKALAINSPHATTLIQRIDANQLNEQEYMRYVVTASDIYQKHENLSQALSILTNTRVTANWYLLTPNEQKQLHKHRANLFAQDNNTQASIGEHISLSTLLTASGDILENNEALWQQLLVLNTTQLENFYQQHHAAQMQNDAILNGWLELALLNKENENDLEAQYRVTQLWANQNPTHPASQELPLDLQLLEVFINNQPQKVALLLPITGALGLAGQTIRDGFLAKNKQKIAQNQATMDVTVYDTSIDDVNTLYDRAVAEGAEIIVGPLHKDKVSQLAQRTIMPVPMIALNYLDDAPSNLSSSFYQFGLSFNDEAKQTADHAWQKGHRYAMVLTTNEDWGARAMNAFVEYWKKRRHDYLRQPTD